MSKSTMSKKPKATDQRERFEQTARELGVELDEEKLKEALARLGQPKAKKEPQIKKKGD